MLVLCVVVDWPNTIYWSWKVVRALRVSIAVYRRGATEMTEDEKKEADIYNLSPARWTDPTFEDEFQKLMKPVWRFMRPGFPIFIWLFSITTVEATIRWNNLSPSTDLASPGQLIPFVAGIFVLFDGFLVLIRPVTADSRLD